MLMGYVYNTQGGNSWKENGMKKNGTQSSLTISNHEANRNEDANICVGMTLSSIWIYILIQTNGNILLK